MNEGKPTAAAHYTVRDCIWNGMAWTVSLTVPTKLDLRARLYTQSDIDAAVAAERERWQQAAKAVIESHDAALAYVYERLRSQGVRGIAIHDTAAAEIRAVNALRELVQPNAQAERRLTAPQEVKDESK